MLAAARSDAVARLKTRWPFTALARQQRPARREPGKALLGPKVDGTLQQRFTEPQHVLGSIDIATVDGALPPSCCPKR